MIKALDTLIIIRPYKPDWLLLLTRFYTKGEGMLAVKTGHNKTVTDIPTRTDT